MAIEVGPDVQIGREIDGDVFMRGRQEAADATLPGQAGDVVGEHLGQRAVEHRRELIGKEPGESGEWTVATSQ